MRLLSSKHTLIFATQMHDFRLIEVDFNWVSHYLIRLNPTTFYYKWFQLHPNKIWDEIIYPLPHFAGVPSKFENR